MRTGSTSIILVILLSHIHSIALQNLGCPREEFQHTALEMLILAKDVRYV